MSDPDWRGIHNLFLANDRAYLAPIGSNERVRGVVIVDLTDPSQPTISGNWTNQRPIFSDRIHDVFVDDGIAYVSDFFSGLVLLDLADPDNPVTLSSVHFTEGIHSAWAHNGYVYCNQEFGGAQRLLHIVDAADPTAPEVVRSFRADVPLEGPAIGPHNPFVLGDWLCWAYYDAGLRVFDISLPENPVEVAHHPSTLAWGAHPHSDGHVYVADSRLGLRAFRFDQPAFAVRNVAPVSPVFAGGTARIEVWTEPLPHRTDQLVSRVVVSVDLPGEPVIVELHDDESEGGAESGDGVFSRSFPVPENLETGTYPLHAWMEDDDGAVYPLNGVLEVQHDQQTAVGGEDRVGLPERSELAQNFPNPFNSETSSALRSRSLAPSIWESTIRLDNDWPHSSPGNPRLAATSCAGTGAAMMTGRWPVACTSTVSVRMDGRC